MINDKSNFVQDIKNFRKTLSKKFRNFYPIKLINIIQYKIFTEVLYKTIYKGFICIVALGYLKIFLKYKNFIYYKISKKSYKENFHANGCFCYCLATTPKKERVFIKIANNLTTLKVEPKLVKKFYDVANKELKCLEIVNNFNSFFVNFLTTIYIEGITLKNFISKNNSKNITKKQKIQMLKQLKIMLEKLNEAGIYGFQTCATHLDNIMISFNKSNEIRLVLIDFGRYKFFNKNKKNSHKFIEKNTTNMTNLVNCLSKKLKMENKYIKEYFDEYRIN
ncbi:hypothetical protein ACFL0U_02300 [Pseudomonadota bacterium]